MACVVPGPWVKGVLDLRPGRGWSPTPTQAPVRPVHPLSGRGLHRENGESGSWRSINTPPQFTSSSCSHRGKGAPCLSLLPLPLPPVRIPSPSCLHLSASTQAFPDLWFSCSSQVPASLSSSPLPTSPCPLLPGLLDSRTHSLWLLPTALLLTHCSHPSLHLGSNPKPTSFLFFF